jgi:phosphohistidine phosphatase
MRIYLMRHGIATPRDEPGSDDASRALTPEGIEKVRRIGNALSRLKIEIDAVWTSPLTRAHQTAELAAGALGLSQSLRIVEDLEPGGDLERLIGQFQAASMSQGLMLVGHEPDMGNLASLLVFGRAGASIQFKKGGIACLEMGPGAGTSYCELLWLLTPKQMIAMT